MISCPIDTYSGYGARSRDVVKAIIEMDKYDVKVLPQRWGNCSWGFIEDHEEDWGFLNQHLFQPQPNQQYPKPDIWMQITIPNEFVPQGHYNIGMTAGIETTLCKPEWVEGCNRMNMVVGSSGHTMNVLTQSKFQQKDNNTQQVIKNIEFSPTTKPEILFEGFNDQIYKKTNEILDLPEIKEPFCFLFVGHWMGGDFGHDRKNVGVLVKSFLETFKNKQTQPALILKTSTGTTSYVDRYEILKRINNIKKTVKGKLPKIYLIHGDLTDEEMNQLYNHPKVKCMVSTTKGEGFGRPLLEFTQTKKPIIVSGWSGHMDFISPQMSVILDGNLEDIHPSVKNEWFIEGAKWFSVNVIDLNNKLKSMYKNYKDFVHGGKKQGNYTKEWFTYEKMKDKLNKILDDNVTTQPQLPSLSLPKLTKVGDNPNPKPIELKLPKLKKV